MSRPIEEEALAPELQALFDADAPRLDVASLSQRAMAHAAPLLAMHAQRQFRRRVVRTLGLALLPLPLVLGLDALLLGALYEVAAAWLPSGIAAYVVISYGVALLVGLGLTYASIPLLLAWRTAAAPSEVHA
jgi:hypothetical protein